MWKKRSNRSCNLRLLQSKSRKVSTKLQVEIYKSTKKDRDDSLPYAHVFSTMCMLGGMTQSEHLLSNVIAWSSLSKVPRSFLCLLRQQKLTVNFNRCYSHCVFRVKIFVHIMYMYLYLLLITCTLPEVRLLSAYIQHRVLAHL